jgi:integrase
MLHISPDYLEPMPLCAYHTGMRKAKILGLTWDHLEAGNAGRSDGACHDLRHTATTSLRRAGVDTLTGMKVTGHKIMAVVKRYNSIDEDDLVTAERRMDA